MPSYAKESNNRRATNSFVRGYPLTRGGFLEYLETQHCGENLQFLDNVYLFKLDPTPLVAREVSRGKRNACKHSQRTKTIVILHYQIVTKFIEDGAPAQINISNSTRSAIEAKCKVNIIGMAL